MWYEKISNDSDVVISSRVRFARNISGYKFPNEMESNELKEIVGLMERNIDKKKYKLLKMEDIDEITKYSLMEQHLISKEFVRNDDGAIVINNDNTIVAMINEEDHLRMQAFDSGLNIDSCYEKLYEFSEKLNKKIAYAENEKYGFLTSCPTNVGSGMRVSIMLHLPALYKIGLLDKLLDQAASIGISVRGLYGENTKGAGYIYQISNQKTLGMTDKDIIAGLKVVATSIIEQERKAREILKRNNKKLEDSLYRSYGLLKYARIISCDEALKCLSDVRLGVSMGIINEIELERIQALMTNIEPYTLNKIFKGEFDKKEDNIKRAEYIRRELD